jgi:hypothetical protein
LSSQLIPNKTLRGKFGCEQAFLPPPAPTEPNQIPLPAHIGSGDTDGGQIMPCSQITHFAVRRHAHLV